MKKDLDIINNIVNKLNLNIKIEDNIYKISNNKNMILKSHSDISFKTNDTYHTENTVNKNLTSQILFNNNIPVPKFMYIDNLKNSSAIDNIIDNINIDFPLVVKPSNGSGGNNVYLNIMNNDQLINTLKIFLNKNINKIMIEKYIHGNDYRITMYKDTILFIIYRSPPVVEGDGINTLKHLINIKNNNNKKYKKYPIKINKLYLDKNNIKLDTIPNKHKKIVLNDVTNFSQGGVFNIFPLHLVHKDNIKLFIKINKILDLNLSGIDFLIKDITKSYKNQKCAVNEVNSCPNIIRIYNYDKKLCYDAITNLFKLYFDIH